MLYLALLENWFQINGFCFLIQGRKMSLCKVQVNIALVLICFNGSVVSACLMACSVNGIPACPSGISSRWDDSDRTTYRFILDIE